jgi:hypothetical protein
MAYSYDGGATVYDQRTNLTWEASGTHASTYADAEWHCLSLTPARSQPWRVPTRIELVSLVDWTHSGPMFDVDAFAYDPDAGTGQGTGTYWSSSLAALNGALPPVDADTSTWVRWTVSFDDGTVTPGYGAWVRCVSGGS